MINVKNPSSPPVTVNEKANLGKQIVLSHCGVIGAAGKMGRGIALILLIQMACNEAKSNSRLGTGKFRLVLIDNDTKQLDTLKGYLRTHLLRFAEKNINKLRLFFAENSSLVSNKEMIDHFVNGACDMIYLSSSIEEARNLPYIFEAIVEDKEIKCQIFQKIDSLCDQPTYYFSNTSSIPISALNEQANLNGRIIGFHFYNPPAVQKLVEIIPLKDGDPNLYKTALTIASQLEKTVVISKDVAGFIGNGHFIREIAVATQMTLKLAQSYPLPQAIYMINRVTGDFLLRPMGIFQLLDYVGLDVAQKIGKIMNFYQVIPDKDNSLIDLLVADGHPGGQFPDGKQKDGFFSYTKHTITGIYVPKEKHYDDISSSSWQQQGDEALGKIPDAFITWSKLSRMPNAQQQINDYLLELASSKSLGCNLANEFLEKSHEIVKKLVDDKIASSLSDVETILKQGFYHLYAPI
jgi:3-hydroxyacyl-CoA dehydrogenase